MSVSHKTPPCQASPQGILDSFHVLDDGTFADVLTEQHLREAFPDDPVEGQDENDGTVYTCLVTTWMFLWQRLQSGTSRSCQAAVSVFRISVIAQALSAPCSNNGSYCRARVRLLTDGLAELVRGVSHRCEEAVPEQWLWHGRRPKLVDGTTMTMPDTEENREAFPPADPSRVGISFPIMRAVCIISLVTGMVSDWQSAPYRGKETGEPSLLRDMLESLTRGDVLVADRYYCGYFMIALLLEQGVDVVMKQHARRTTDFARGRRLGKGDHVVFWTKPQRPEWMDEETYRRLPDKLEMREADVQVEQKGFRTGKYIVVTNLIDAEEFPRKDLAELYRSRWHVELDFRTLKCILELDHLSCRTPEMVEKEIWATFLAYNLVRLAIANACALHGGLPRQVSFTNAKEMIISGYKEMILANGETKDAIREDTMESMVKHRVGNRPDRIEPRRVKKRPKPHKWLNESREEARKRVIECPEPGGSVYSPADMKAAEETLESEIAAERRDVARE